MDLIAGLNELIAQMEEDLEIHDPNGVIRGYIRTLKTIIKAAAPKAEQATSDGGVSISIGGSSQPQQPPPPSRPFKANRKPADPWEEARKKAAAERCEREALSEDDDEYDPGELSLGE